MEYPVYKRLSRIVLCVLLAGMAAGIHSCRQKYTPLPDGYFRIDPYPCSYERTDLLQPSISFEIPEGTVASVNNDSSRHGDDVQWLDIRFPRYQATLYCSYHTLRGNLDRLLSESKDLVYRQSIRPDVVQANSYEDDEQRIYATLYDLSAESATPLQFVVTDSSLYLMRGSLYFDEPGKSDSIAPVIDDLSNHIAHLIESIEIPVR